jgi:hypothetical protein
MNAILAGAQSLPASDSIFAQATQVASLCWLAVIGVPETFCHLRDLFRREEHRGQRAHGYWNPLTKENNQDDR